MAVQQLNLEQTREMLLHVARGIVGKKEELTKADQAIGDGDHGVGMARGFESVVEKLEGQPPEALDQLFMAVGMALISNIGGAAGAVFGTLFRAGGKALNGQAEFKSQGLALFLKEGLRGVVERGRASVGDKTMIDALEPAALKAEELATSALSDSIKAVVEAGERGMEGTKEMIATTGKAKTLGERSLGHADPGSISMVFILNFMAEYIANKEE